MATRLLVTVKPSGGDSTTLQGAFAHAYADNGNSYDLVTADKYLDIEIDGTWNDADTTQVTIDDWVTSATCYVNIYTTSAARHAGVWSTSKYRLSVGAGAGGAITLMDVNYVRINGIQIERTAANGHDQDGFHSVTTLGASGANDIRLSNLIIKGHASAYYAETLVRCLATNGMYYVWNVIGYNCGSVASSYGCRVAAVDGVLRLSNSVFIGGTYCYSRGSGNQYAKNCYLGGGATACTDLDWQLTTCATSDATSTTEALRNIAVNTTQFVNVTGGSENFHLAGTGSALYRVGTDTSGDTAPMDFDTDIDGDAYYDTDSKRSIGADEYVVAATNVVMKLI